jgi:plasmid replication initiation protein
MGLRREGVPVEGLERQPEMVALELNLEESYLFSGSPDRMAAKVREYTHAIRLANGRPGKRTLRFTPSAEYGDLDAFDRDVYVAMIFLVQMRGGMPVDGKVSFSLYELVKILNLPHKGQSFRRVRESILRQNKLQIDGEMYSKETRSYESEHFSVWRVHFKANLDKHGRASEHHTVTFDEVMVRSYQAGYIKQLDANFYFSLDKKHARPLYGRIDVGREGGLMCEFPLSDVKEALSMASSYKAPSQIKRALGPAHEELLLKGFLRDVSYPQDGVVRYEVAKEFEDLRAHSSERRWSVEENAAIRALIRCGVWANVAHWLVEEQGAATCMFYVDGLQYQENVRNPGAWLKKFIGERLPLPVEPPQRKLEEAELAPSAAFDIRPKAPEPVADPEAEELWEEVLARSSEEIDAPSWRVWFEGTVPVAIGNSVLTISVPNSFAEEYISGRFKGILENHLRALRGGGWAIRIAVAGREGNAD